MESDSKIVSHSVVGIAVLLIAALLFSCKNDIEAIRSLELVDTIPDLSAKEVEIYYSERGFVQIKLVAPTLVRTLMEDEPVIEFPDGFTTYFYDSLQQVKSYISADYGISYEKKKMMEARHNVIVENLESKEKLNTEELFWDRVKEIIYTEKFVRITRGEEIITADGLESNQTFESMEFKNPKGLIEVEEEE